LRIPTTAQRAGKIAEFWAAGYSGYRVPNYTLANNNVSYEGIWLNTAEGTDLSFDPSFSKEMREKDKKISVYMQH
jgi:hypothetical protein